MSNEPKQSSRMGMKIAAVLITLLIASVLSYSYARALRDGAEWKIKSEKAVISPTYREDDLSKAKVVPDFALKDRQGKVIKFSEFSSVDVVLVNIWTTGCPTCQSELPSLMEMDKRLSSIGNVLLITITTNEEWKEVQHLFPKGTDLRVLFDPEEKVTKDIFGSTRYPETFILDKKRRIRVRFDGERPWHSKTMLDFIASYKKSD